MSARRSSRLFPALLSAVQQGGAAGTQVGVALFSLQALCAGGQRLRLPGQGMGLLGRTFASQPLATADAKDRFDSTNSLLQQVQVLKLRQELDDESVMHLHIPYTQLLQMIKASGSAHDDKEAEEVALALHRAGVVMRHHDVVYLRPEEIAEVVMQVLPGGKDDASQKLAKIEEELTDLDKIHAQVDKQANNVTTRLLTVGYVVLFVQLISFIYLTWWELSWDVMEPIAYIISLFYSLLGYTYFMATKGGVFDLQPFKEFWQTHYKQKKASAVQFDAERYEYLLKMKERYKRHLAHAALRR